jgi:glycosyltransferase involved in cell wall biosynthesis
MNIGIEARSLSYSGSGTSTYVRQLITHLLTQPPSHEFHVIYDDQKHMGTFPSAHEYYVKRYGALDVLPWLNWRLPRQLSDLKLNVTHFTKADVPYLKRGSTIVTIYDVIPLLNPSGQGRIRRLYWPTALRRAVRLSDHILTISERSKQDIIQHLGVAEHKITVTPLAASKNFSPVTDISALDRVRLKYNLPDKFILYLGRIDTRKNIPTLIRAFAQATKEVPHSLIIAGKKDHQHRQTWQEIIDQKVQDKVIHIDYIETNDMSAIYSAASLFVFPSTYEGWGIPPLEAMACGTPVIVSDGGALPEVVGDAAKIVPFTLANLAVRHNDNNFEQDLTKAIVELLNNETTQNLLRKRGPDRASQFSWDTVAKQTILAYQKASTG